MAFARRFDTNCLLRLQESDRALFALLQADIASGTVFPAVRCGALDFYYKGGRLYRLAGGRLKRDPRYALYAKDCEGLLEYERAKRENERRFERTDGVPAKRQYLDALLSSTYCKEKRGTVAVLDIEVRLGSGKCDLVLYNTQTAEITFVEGKIFSDNRVKCARGYIPEVIAQTKRYSSAIEKNEAEILGAYAEYVSVINGLFLTDFKAPVCILKPCKLLVYETDLSPTENGLYSIETIEAALGKENVYWVKKGKSPSLEEIWAALAGEACL